MKLSRLLLLAWLVTVPLLLHAQKSKTSKSQKSSSKTNVAKAAQKLTPNVAEDEKKVRDLVAFFQFMLNTLGSKQTSSRDKDVMITESYSKIFRDNKVQIEDDLDADRKVITNKDVTAYLKDVDYFFDDVKFEFAIEQVKAEKQTNGETYYQVVATRHLAGTKADGKSVSNTQPRHLEINYNPENQDLKIASVYTNEFNEKEALTHWWNELSLEWKEIFSKKLNLPEEPILNDIKNVTSIQELDLDGNTYIQNLDPLSQLSDLRMLNLSHTTIRDVSPLRNLTELRQLNVSHSQVIDLTPIKYSILLELLDISDTQVSDLSVLTKLPKLKTVDISGVPATDFSALRYLSELQSLNAANTRFADPTILQELTLLTQLDLSSTLVSDVTHLGGLVELEALELDSTRVMEVRALDKMHKLKVLHVNHTNVADLSPLQGLPKLEKIYCDQTKVSADDLDEFAKTNPKVLIVFDSKNMTTWWQGLSPEWQEVFSNALQLNDEQFTKEQLARISSLDSINISGTPGIQSLEPLRMVPKLKILVAHRSGIVDLSPLKVNRDLTYLDISETHVVNVSVLNQLSKLQIVMADESDVQDVEKLKLPGIQKFYADQTSVHDIIAIEFLEKNPDCLLIYKTNHLQRWWSALPNTWKEIFTGQLGLHSNPSREALHKLIEQETVEFKDQPVNNLRTLDQFIRLKNLHLSGTALASISLPECAFGLTSLHITHSPIQKIDSLFYLSNLEDLNISDTPLDDIYDVWRLKKLKKLKCSGTQIKRLDGLEKLENLELLDCSNTNVSKLSPLDYLPLKTLWCYNTKASNRTIENFKQSHPDCKVMYYR